jgi:hypothetical protein
MNPELEATPDRKWGAGRGQQALAAIVDLLVSGF